MSAITRGRCVLAGLIAAGTLFLITRAVWVRADVSDLVGGSSALEVTGAQAASAAAACAAVALAASAVLALASRPVRWVSGPLMILTGAGAAIAAWDVHARPSAHAATAIAQKAGASGGVSGSISSVAVAVWPLVALVPCAVLVALGTVVLIRGRAWPTRTRFEREGGARATPTAAAVREDPAATWDALSRGEDPTDAPTRTGGPPTS